VNLNGLSQSRDGFIALAHIPTPTGVIRLASPVDGNEYAQVLYETLRRADRMGLKVIVAISPTTQGISLAIDNRLRKASFSK
jgi:hypothetical protein